MTTDSDWIDEAEREVTALEESRRQNPRHFRGERIRGKPLTGAKNVRVTELSSRLTNLAQRADRLIIR